MNLALHPTTEATIEAYSRQPGRPVLLVGQAGIGKRAVADALIKQLFATEASETTSLSYAKVITADDKKSISIDAIRDLQRFLKLKTTGKAELRRIVLIEDAHFLTTEAQNALLKTIEEPPSDTLIIATALSGQSLLPTIQSRIAQIELHAPSQAQLLSHFQRYAEKDVMQAYRLSGGLPGLMSALLANTQDHPLFASVTLAKTFLQQSLFERLAHVEQLSKQKASAVDFCEALQRIAHAALEVSATKPDTAKTKQWHHILQAAHHTSQLLKENVNTKLALTQMILQLSS